MRQFGIPVIAVVAAAAVWAFALNHSGAKTQDRVSGGISSNYTKSALAPQRSVAN